ncbi:MAG: phage head-tail connector protein [Rhodobacteraceae bacterium]|nr:phage head-tail connector protein [Paracoccaceae bacterium]
MPTLLTGPEPILTLAEAQAHVRVDSDDDQDYITALIDVVTAFLDGPRGTLGRYFAHQTWVEVYTSIGQGFQLPFGPVISVDSITHDGGAITGFDLSESNGVWSVVPTGTWPDTSGDIIVNFTVGISPIPAPIKMAAMLHLGTLYENRESVVVGTISGLLPNGYEALLAPYRLWGGR